jgi:hypothetical protein
VQLQISHHTHTHTHTLFDFLKITPTELRERRVPNVSAKNASRVVRQARQGLSGQCPGALRRPQTTALGALAGLRAHETGGRGFAGARGISQHN